MLNNADSDQTLTSEKLETELGFSVAEVYELAYSFFSEKSEKAFHLKYDDRVHLSALSLQVKYGTFDASKVPTPGFLDFFGRARIAKWETFGDMSAEEAKWQFIKRINQLCPLFLPFVEAHARNSQAKDSTCSNAVASGDAASSANSCFSVQDFVISNESEIRAALNSQTKEQFEAYAMQQYPTDADKRAELITDLQNRHFHEYVDYIQHHYDWNQHTVSLRSGEHEIKTSDDSTGANYVISSNASCQAHDGPGSVHASAINDQLPISQNCEATPQVVPSSYVTNSAALTNPGSATAIQSVPPVTSDRNLIENHSGHLAGLSSSSSTPSALSENPNTRCLEDTSDICSDTETSSQTPYASNSAVVCAPSMWTRGEIREFKSHLADTKNAIVQVGCGEVITVRVPTYPSGLSIVWEFATDDYDIAFGLFFEWSGKTEVSTTVSESITEDTSQVTDPSIKSDEIDSSTPSMTDPNPDLLVDEIIPVYRRKSHEEVYCGSHTYPGMGTYLFKFDNSYSLWRSKTLYYRVYYTC